MKLDILLCKCGQPPAMELSQKLHVYTTQIKCRCGEQTALLMHTQVADHAEMQRVAVEAWNCSR